MFIYLKELLLNYLIPSFPQSVSVSPQYMEFVCTFLHTLSVRFDETKPPGAKISEEK